MLRPVFGRRYAKPPFKYIAEIIGIRITYIPCYHITFFICFDQLPGCLVRAVIRQIADKGIPRFLLKNS